MKKQSFLSLSLVVCLALGLLNCGKKKDDPKPGTGTPPTTVSTAPALDKAATATTSSDITAEAAKVSSTLTGNGGAAITQHGHVWSDTKAEPTTTDAKTELGKTDGPFPLKFTSDLKSLKANTTYNVRAYATNDKGTSYGTAVQVKTVAAPTEQVFGPNLVLEPTTNIKTTSATLNTFINALGNRPIVAYGFVLSDTDKNPKAGGSFTRQVSASSPTGALPFVFKLDVTELKPNMTYYVRSYATYKINETTTAYSESVLGNFTTQSDLSGNANWKELGPYSSGIATAYDFYYGGNFYDIGYTELSTFSFVTQKQTLNAGPRFPGIGNVALFKLVGKKAYTLMSGRESTKATNEVWEYDLEAKKWTRKADFPGIPRADGLALALNGKLYFGTGNEYTVGRPGYATTLKDWWEYDPATDNWTQKANAPLAGYGLRGFDAAGKVVMGMGLGFGSGIKQENWFEYNPQTNAWRSLPQIVGDYVAYSGLLWEENFNGKNYALLLDKTAKKYAMWSYRPSSGTWTRESEFPAALPQSGGAYFSSYSINGKPILMYHSKQLVFEYTP